MTLFKPGDVVRHASPLMDRLNGPGTVKTAYRKSCRVIWNKNPNQWAFFAALVLNTDLKPSPDDPQHPQWG
jgi:hypothetical protein